MMNFSIRPPQLTHYQHATQYEWLQADGLGGMAASTVIGANTRKQHGLLTINTEDAGSLVLLSNLQETAARNGRAYDLATNAYFGAIHPEGYRLLESFTLRPWPTWRFRLDGLVLQKELILVRGEHTLLAVYSIPQGSEDLKLTVRPLLAFREAGCVRSESGRYPNPWGVTSEFIECRPYENMGPLFISHPNARVETLGLWYRGFIYERDRESRVDFVEDLYHPGYIEMTISPGTPKTLIFSTPSPRGIATAGEFIETERHRRRMVTHLPDVATDPFFDSMLLAAEQFIYERPDGFLGIRAGLPFGESEVYRGLLAFPGLLLTAHRFDEARSYLSGVERDWRTAQSPFRFSPEVLPGQMHPADVPLWVFIGAWRYWKAAGDDSFIGDTILPLLQDIVENYIGAGEVRCSDDGLLAVGFEQGADYAPMYPLGTNMLWYNAQMILGALMHRHHKETALKWRARADRTLQALAMLFSCGTRPGFADAVFADTNLSPEARKDETLRASQILSIGLPYHAAPDAEAVVRLIEEKLATPYGLRTIDPGDSRYTGDGSDVMLLPKTWSGSIDPTWLGAYRDAFRYIHGIPATPPVFAPLENELRRRGLGHISGAFTGNYPHTPCDFVASASGLGETMRIYARDVLHYGHVV